MHGETHAPTARHTPHSTMSIVTLHVSCSSAKIASERRFDKGLTILEVKGKLELITGAVAAHMKLVLRTPEDKDVCVMDNNDAMLGSYPCEDHMHLHVRRVVCAPRRRCRPLSHHPDDAVR